jgi:D-3-phosphoglycerate dehydrogenase
MQMLVACELPDFAQSELRSLGVKLAYEPAVTAEQLPRLIGSTTILVVDTLRVTPEAIAAARNLQMIIRAGFGPGQISVEEASMQGIFVVHCPEKDAAALAEMTFALLLALDRRIVENTETLREGRWNRAQFTGARGLAGRSLGVLGLGRVGREVAGRARAFGMTVLGWSPTLTPERAAEWGVEFCNWPRDLARRSDMVSVHAGPEAGEQHLVDAEFLDSLPIGAYLVHVGPPTAIDEAALVDAIPRRQLRVALDVHAGEPSGDTGKFRSRVLALPGVLGTHHVGGITAQMRDAVAREIVRLTRAFVVNGEVQNCLNLAERSPATWQLLLRVRDAVGVMASILDSIRADGINAEEISSRVFTGAKAAWCTIALDERPSTEALDAIRALPDVLHLELRAMV